MKKLFLFLILLSGCTVKDGDIVKEVHKGWGGYKYNIQVYEKWIDSDLGMLTNQKFEPGDTIRLCKN